MNLTDFLQRPLRCKCGRIHETKLRDVIIAKQALTALPQLIMTHGHKNIFVICDQTTYDIAGKQVLSILSEHKIAYTYYTLADYNPIPDEQSVGSILMHLDPHSDLVIGVGSGTINDLTRFISFQTKRPYYIVATAPSMDGYASSVAPLITDNLKTTYETHMPTAIVADTDIITAAPKNMIAAGFGDILGKYTCLMDWQLSQIINDEYYCETITRMMQLALERTNKVIKQLSNHDPEAIVKLMEALILAGIAMSYAGNSRPASGSEHHLAHFWEMNFLLSGRKPILHGTKVAIATVLVLKLYEYLQNEPQPNNHYLPPTGAAEWTEEMQRCYGKASSGVIELEKDVGKNDLGKHQERLPIIVQKWDQIQQAINTLPNAEQISTALLELEAPVDPRDVGIDGDTVYDSIRYAKELRPRYTVLQLLWDLGLLDSFAVRLSKQLF